MLKLNAGKHFIPYLTAGHQGLEATYQSALLLIEAGATVLEIGVPFSDPIADGPIISFAMHDALARGVCFQDV